MRELDGHVFGEDLQGVCTVDGLRRVNRTHVCGVSRLGRLQRCQLGQGVPPIRENGMRNLCKEFREVNIDVSVLEWSWTPAEETVAVQVVGGLHCLPKARSWLGMAGCELHRGCNQCCFLRHPTLR